MLISIIIPFYNSEEFIERSLMSCLTQSYSDIEIIMVDDGSTDKSSQIISVVSGGDSRVRVISQKNAGASAARNKGLDVARGEFVMFLDSDDWIDPDMIQDMLQIVKDHPDIQLVQTRVPNDMKQQTEEGVYTTERSVKCLLEGSWWGPVCKLIRKDAIGGIRFPDKTISEDYLFNYQVFSSTDALFYKDKCYYHRTSRPGSLSRIGICKRKFDEFYNVKAVSDMVAVDFPHNQSLANVHLAGTCLKLLFTILGNHAEETYQEELNDLLKCIKANYFSFLGNPGIPKNERLLLSTCISIPFAKLTENLYHRIK